MYKTSSILAVRDCTKYHIARQHERDWWASGLVIVGNYVVLGRLIVILLLRTGSCLGYKLV